jgi:hypothetical protein
MQGELASSYVAEVLVYLHLFGLASSDVVQRILRLKRLMSTSLHVSNIRHRSASQFIIYHQPDSFNTYYTQSIIMSTFSEYEQKVHS